MPAPRTVCAVITSRVHYARSKRLLAALRARADVRLQIIVGGSALLPKYGEVVGMIERDGFEISERLHTVIEGGNHIAMAKTAGLAILEFSTALQRLNPDVVLIRGDRFEKLSAAVAAAYLNKTVAHIEGGDVSGSIDESVRHAITKLSHLHFPTNEDSRRRILAMGEDPAAVFNVGSLEAEFARETPDISDEELQRALDAVGTGDRVDIRKPFLVVLQHPVTTEDHADVGGESAQARNVQATLDAVAAVGMPVLWFWPNIDAGTDAMSKTIRQFRESGKAAGFRFLKNIDPESFTAVLRRASCMVGNSSSAVKECSVLGVPAVDVGLRQQGRAKLENLLGAPYEAASIAAAIRTQVAHGRYAPNGYYVQEGTSARIAELLATAPLYTQKRFYDHRS